MSTLFVDCDDTLVLWQYEEKEVEGQTVYVLPNEGEPYLVNEALIASVRHFLSTHPHFSLVVWSGGGEEYAWRWGQRFFSEVEHEAEAKEQGRFARLYNLRRVVGGDICIDDQQLDLPPGVLLLTWERFVESFPAPAVHSRA